MIKYIQLFPQYSWAMLLIVLSMNCDACHKIYFFYSYVTKITESYNKVLYFPDSPTIFVNKGAVGADYGTYIDLDGKAGKIG